LINDLNYCRFCSSRQLWLWPSCG